MVSRRRWHDLRHGIPDPPEPLTYGLGWSATVASREIGVDRILLTDFGIARLREDTSYLTATGTFTATIAYAAPEQLTGAPVTAATDQYSLACTLVKILTGAAPFDAPHAGEVIRGHLQLDPPPLRTRRPGLPADLDSVLTRAMAKRPEDRYRTCGEFAGALRAATVRAGHLSAPTLPYPSYPPAPKSGQVLAPPIQVSPHVAPAWSAVPPDISGPIGDRTARASRHPVGGIDARTVVVALAFTIGIVAIAVALVLGKGFL